MENKNLSISIKLVAIGMLLLTLIIVISLYFSDFNINYKRGFNIPVKNLTQ